MRWVAAALFAYTALTCRRRRYIASWYERVDDGPWRYRTEEMDDPALPWMGALAFNDLFVTGPVTTITGAQLEKRRGL